MKPMTRQARSLAIFVVAGLMMPLASLAHAELEQVQMGGDLVILGEYSRNAETTDEEVRWPSMWLPRRPVGLGPGNADGILSEFRWDDQGNSSSFEVGWARLFVGHGLASGNFTSENGLEFNGGQDDDDADYLYTETRLKF